MSLVLTGCAIAASSWNAYALASAKQGLPSDPTSLTATLTQTPTVELAWSGTSAEFRVQRRIGISPTSPTDGMTVYEGSGTSFSDTDVVAGVDYFYRVWGKAAGAEVFSGGSQAANVTTPANPRQRYVDYDALGDQGECTDQDNPCRTITYAMSRSGSGDTIWVMNIGPYDVGHGEVFPIEFRSGVQLIASGDSGGTVIDGAGDPVRRGLFLSVGNASTDTRIQGFTLRNGEQTANAPDVALGGAIRVEASNPGSLFTITNNIFRDNQAQGYHGIDFGVLTGGAAGGGAIGVASASLRVVNNIFLNDGAQAGNGGFADQAGNAEGGDAVGGALFLSGAQEASVVNNTFHANYALGGNGGLANNVNGDQGLAWGGAMLSATVNLTVANNIFSQNGVVPGKGTVAAGTSGAGALAAPNAQIVTHNLFFSNFVDQLLSADDTLGANSVAGDPKFHATPDNLRLRKSSPAANAGMGDSYTPPNDFELSGRGGQPSIGAFEESLANQSIVFGNAPVLQTNDSASVNVTPGGSSSPLVLTSLTESICTVMGTTVTAVSVGTCTLSANQAGDLDYFPASQVTQSFQILSGPGFALDLNLSGTGSGTVTSAPAGIACGSACSASFDAETLVTLTAAASSGSVFLGWSGDCSGNGFTCQVTLSQARTVGVQFNTSDTVRSLSVGRSVESWNRSSRITSAPSGIDCGSGCGGQTVDFERDSSVTLSADPGSDSRFLGWSGDCTGSELTCQVTLSQARSVIATFSEAWPFSLTVDGPGNVNGNNGVGFCSSNAQCDRVGYVGTTVTLTADPFFGAVFVGWSGDCSGSAPTCEVTMSQVRTVSAQFAPSFNLSVGVTGVGVGVVTSAPVGINCTPTCSANFATGTVVILTATPSPDSYFAGWSGACNGSVPTCEVTMSQARSVTAQFVPPLPLTVVRTGNGTGKVTSMPAGIDCGNVCAANFGAGTVVTLTATPSAGSTFGGWTGACSGSAQSCQVTLSQAREVTASFGIQTGALYPLDVSHTGLGSGTVASVPAGIDCGNSCNANFADGTLVTLTATPANGSKFVWWTGDVCAGSTVPVCQFTITQARSAQARFDIETFNLTVTRTGSGTGTVTSLPAGIDCGNNCNQWYDTGTLVMLTATPDNGSVFAGWGGACTGLSLTCQVTMSQTRNVSAKFKDQIFLDGFEN